LFERFATDVSSFAARCFGRLFFAASERWQTDS
jgi:hypothetical protein